MSFTDQLAKLEKAKAELAAAEAKLAADRIAALAKLPSEYGFDDLNAFLKAVKDAYGSKGASGSGRKRRAGADAAKGAKKGSKRVKITDEIRLQVKKLAEEGKTGQEIANFLGISAPSVQNIKKAFGLVKSRGSSSSASAPAEAPAAEAAPAPAA